MQNSPIKTRQAILNYLKMHGGVASHILARQFSLTPMAIRLQLADLEKDNLVKSSSQNMGRGRPSKIWALTEAAQKHFPDAHQTLALQLLSLMKTEFGEKGLEKIISAHGAAQLANYNPQVSAQSSLQEKLITLAKIRTDEGYMAQVDPTDGGFLFIENHCPICSAAKECTRLCKNELEVFQSVLGSNVKIERQEHIISGARRCAYLVI